jgi:hypothetical protein
MTNTATARPDVYSKITDKIIADLEQGIRPWLRPWNADHAAGRITRPLRHNGILYKGLSVVMLWSCRSTGQDQVVPSRPVKTSVTRYACALFPLAAGPGRPPHDAANVRGSTHQRFSVASRQPGGPDPV